MSSAAWINQLSSPDVLCKCGHAAKFHHHGKDCTAYEDESRLRYCKCEEFREVSQGSENQIQEEGDSMATKQKKQHKVSTRKSGVRKSNLLYFANEAKLKSFDDGRLLDKKEKNYTAVIAQTLVSAGDDGLGFDALVTAVGKIVKHKNEKTLRLSTRWYLSSKRSDVAKFVTSKREEAPELPKAPKAAKKAKAPKAPKAAKAKRVRKPRAVKPVATTGPDDAPAPAVAQGEGEAAD